MSAPAPEQMRELANALRRDAGDYARYMARSLPVDEIGSWDMREVRAWQASEFIEAITVVPTMVTLTMNTLLTEGGHGPNSAARNEYARRLTQAISAVFDAPRVAGTDALAQAATAAERLRAEITGNMSLPKAMADDIATVLVELDRAKCKGDAA